MTRLLGVSFRRLLRGAYELQPSVASSPDVGEIRHGHRCGGTGVLVLAVSGVRIRQEIEGDVLRGAVVVNVGMRTGLCPTTGAAEYRLLAPNTPRVLARKFAAVRVLIFGGTALTADGRRTLRPLCRRSDVSRMQFSVFMETSSVQSSPAIRGRRKASPSTPRRFGAS